MAIGTLCVVRLVATMFNVPYSCIMSRTGDRECPMRETGNKMTETIRQAIEDPMLMFVESKTQARLEKYARVEHLKVNVLV